MRYVTRFLLIFLCFFLKKPQFAHHIVVFCLKNGKLKHGIDKNGEMIYNIW